MNEQTGVKSMRMFPAITPILTLIVCIFVALPPLQAGAVSVEIGPFELNLRPGDEYFGSVRVWNNELDPVDIRIYPGDWLQTPIGEQYLDVGEVPNSMTEWMHVSPDHMTIPGGGSSEIYFQIKVPDDPELTGSYWGIFFVEGVPGLSELEPTEDQIPSLGLKIVLRHGIKIYVTIPGTEDKKAKFTTAKTMASEGGGMAFVATLENHGNTYIRPEAWIEIHDWNGNIVYTDDHRTITILPEMERDYTFELGDMGIQPGRYVALIIADYGAVSLVAAQAEIEIKERSPT